MVPKRARTSLGVAPNASFTESLNCRIDPYPAANAMSDTGSAVASSSRRAVWARRLRASVSGPTPNSATSVRCRCRSLTASVPARAATPSSWSQAPSAISRRARPARSARTFQSGEPGTLSGRHRRQVRNPAASAAAATRKKRTFSGFGVRAGQIGRQ